MTPQPKSTYRLICERECEWCAKGMSMSANPLRHWTGNRNPPDCTAPSMESVIERQAKEIEELRVCLDRAREARPAAYAQNALNWSQCAAMKEEPNA